LVAVTKVEVFAITGRIDELFALGIGGRGLWQRVLVDEDDTTPQPIKHMKYRTEISSSVSGAHRQFPECGIHALDFSVGEHHPPEWARVTLISGEHVAAQSGGVHAVVWRLLKA
jgi:hypothetical protein